MSRKPSEYFAHNWYATFWFEAGRRRPPGPHRRGRRGQLPVRDRLPAPDLPVPEAARGGRGADVRPAPRDPAQGAGRERRGALPGLTSGDADCGVNRLTLERLSTTTSSSPTTTSSCPSSTAHRCSRSSATARQGCRCSRRPTVRPVVGLTDLPRGRDPVILDGGCEIAECCGVMARITIGDEIVRWSGFWTSASRPVPDRPALRVRARRLRGGDRRGPVGSSPPLGGQLTAPGTSRICVIGSDPRRLR